MDMSSNSIDTDIIDKINEIQFERLINGNHTRAIIF